MTNGRRGRSVTQAGCRSSTKSVRGRVGRSCKPLLGGAQLLVQVVASVPCREAGELSEHHVAPTLIEPWCVEIEALHVGQTAAASVGLGFCDLQESRTQALASEGLGNPEFCDVERAPAHFAEETTDDARFRPFGQEDAKRRVDFVSSYLEVEASEAVFDRLDWRPRNVRLDLSADLGRIAARFGGFESDTNGGHARVAPPNGPGFSCGRGHHGPPSA